MKTAAALAVVILAVACEAAPDVTYTQHVQPLLEQHCARCHQDGAIAPFTLTDYDQASKMSEMIAAAVASRAMPPWLAGPDCETYADDPSLSDDDIATFVRWAELGAPRGPETTTTTQSALVDDATSLSRVDLTLGMLHPYTPNEAALDDYRCFLLDWPVDHDVFVTGFGVRPGDPQIVHHVIAFTVDPEHRADAFALDDADDLPGYECFGDAIVEDGGLGGWAPGSNALAFPAGTGIRVRAGSLIALQVHYNTAAGAGHVDQTQFDVRIDDHVDKEAIIVPFTNPIWLDGDNMLIPAGEIKTHWFDAAVSDFTDQPFVIYTANAHMHLRGTSETLWIEREDGEKDCLLDIPQWDFHWQLTYVLDEPKVVFPEDKLGIECRFDNTAQNQPRVGGVRGEPHDVRWGEGTGDEMCLGFYYVTDL